MSAQYRIVYFVPDPYRGDRVAIAALVDGIGLVPRPGGLAGLGLLDAGARGLVRASLAELATVGPARELPITIGPQVVGGPVREVPEGVASLSEWVTSALFGRVSLEAQPTAERVHRVRLGIQFLRTRRIDGLVARRFALPGRELLGVVSQYVRGRDETLLLEPIALARPRADAEVRSVAQLFAAYAGVLGADRTTRRVAYVLAGGLAERRSHMIGELRDYADVIDTTVPHEADELVDRIKVAAATGRNLAAE